MLGYVLSIPSMNGPPYHSKLLLLLPPQFLPPSGPDVGGPNGPYRQSERAEIYKSYVDKLVAAGAEDGNRDHCSCLWLDRLRHSADE
jgi:hypothetical protein